MTLPNLNAIAPSLVQSAGAVLLAILLHGFHRHYRRDYLLQWSRSWWALATFLVATAVSQTAARGIEPRHPVALALATITLVAGYWQIAWLLIGTSEVTSQQLFPVRRARWILLALLAGSVVAALLFATAPPFSPEQDFARRGVRSLAAGVAFLMAGAATWRAWPRGSGWGRALVVAAFLGYGIEEVQYFAASLVEVTGGATTVFAYTAYLGYVDAVLQSVLGLGMVAWLLEEERWQVGVAAEQIQHLAYHDVLTGLPNRLLFIDRLQVALAQSRRSGRKVAVFFLDLDRFKDVNDSLGHSSGDELLQAAAERLSRISRQGDTVARLGGDEFTLLVRDINPEDVGLVAGKILEAIQEPYKLNSHELHISTSIGICLHPDDGTDPETLLKNADTAMYHAKEHGRNTFALYTASMNARAQDRLQLENELRRAIVNGELVLHYQPIQNRGTGLVEAVEALVRWQHPTRGLLPPGAFLHLADGVGVTDALDEWVLREACRQTRVWRASGHPNLRVAVNVSARPFQRPDFAERVIRVLKEVDLPAAALDLEITETVAMANADASLTAIRELKARGVRISIDDFGTGHSSLSYLRRFPLDTLKIDQSFVRDLPGDENARAIAAAVIDLAHRMKMTVVAEGVENDDQRRVLETQACDQLQGFLFHRPLPPDEVVRLLS
ncbi:MAG TPA: EAL domain-containing protein [Gemmatimonadales bacterium]|nr:EAL domain-containing protein [Gemmatimonadales bacterium]